jgi:RNA polymerase sigma factor (TIGR02999 family)
MGTQASLTEQLRLFLRGDAAFGDAVATELAPKLREIAGQYLRRERYSAPLGATELIHEFWIRSLSSRGLQIENRAHFYALASRIMRRTLISLARKRLAERRGGWQTAVSLDDISVRSEPRVEDASRIIEVGVLMEQLEAELPDAAWIVDMHDFAGFSIEEIAEAVHLTPKQVLGRWKKGRQWLIRKVRPKIGRRSSLLKRP